MLLVWYTPPSAGAQQYYADWLMRWQEVNNVRDDEEALLLLWWGMIETGDNNG